MNTPLTFVTIKWGSKYSADYVNILFDMVRRNLPPDYNFSFVCFTDDASGILSGIETRPLPSGLTGWWNKLYLFKQGVFADGARLFFLDLDTAITGDLHDIAAYEGDFAILRDFYNPAGFNSSIMLWRSGFGHSIWQSYEHAGRPDISGGDQVWIDRCKPQADILQDLFPNAFISFKEKAQLALPADAKIVCFHGLPKPPQIKNGWVEQVWKIGGAAPAASERAAPHASEQPIENIRHAMTLSLPWLDMPAATDTARHLCIVGGGASAAVSIDELKNRQREGQTVWALNGMYRWLADHGIEADAQVMSSPRAFCARHVPMHDKPLLFYASQCHPDVFEKAARVSTRIVIWHPQIDGIHNLTGSRRAVFIGGGNTTGIKAIGLAQTLGFGNIHLYGFDSSFAAGSPPPAGRAANDEDRRITVEIDGHNFASSPRLAQQINDYRLLKPSLMPKGITLTVHGEGLLPYVARKLAGINAP